MSIEITVPRLGWSMDEGTFAEWLKRDGDWVQKGDLLFVLESEKAAQEIESFDEGVLRLMPDGPQAGEIVKVGQTIGYLVANSESAAPIQYSAPTPTTAAHDVAIDSRTESTHALKSAAATFDRTSSPRARRVAGEVGVDWTQLTGTGRGGRIRERDVREAAAQSVSLSSHRVAVSPLRRLISERLLDSSQSTAPVTLMRRVEATQLMSLRKQFVSVDADAAPTMTALIIKLTSLALMRHPGLNACWQGDHIELHSDIHMGVAIDTPQGLLVPVVSDINQLSVREVSAKLQDLKVRALARRLHPEELRGGTFTITNLGAFGVESFTPILNLPEVAILGVGAIRREAVVLDDDRIVPRDTMSLSLTFDHRVNDGAPAAEFLRTLRDAFENPAAWLIGS